MRAACGRDRDEGDGREAARQGVHGHADSPPSVIDERETKMKDERRKMKDKRRG
jgi:hypothetical protein